VKELVTVDIPDVEILAVGTWDGSPQKATYTKGDLDRIVLAFNELRGNGELNYEPPVKLGHDENQKLLQKDGYPAAGWIRGLKRVGDKLVARFEQVPRRIAEIIKAGGWRSVSSELYVDYAINGKSYPLVLKAVSLLGQDIPAVKTIAAIKAQYDEQGQEYHTVIYDLAERKAAIEAALSPGATLGEILANVDIWLEKADRTELKEAKSKLKALIEKEYKVASGDKGENMTEKLAEWTTEYINDLPDSAFAFIRGGGEKDEEGKTVPRALRSLPYRDTSGEIDLPHLRNALARLPQSNLTPEEQAKARKVLVDAARKVGVGEYEELPKTAGKTQEEEENLMEAEVRAELGLTEGADILEAIRALKQAAEHKKTEFVALSEHQALEGKVEKLQTILAERDRDDAVRSAITSGKLLPAQKAWADDYALRNPGGFAKFIETAPVVVKLGEIGASGEGLAIELTEKEIEIGAQLGVSKEELIAAKKMEVR